VQFFYHWVWLDFYIPVWPNIAASLVIFFFLIAKLRAMDKMHKLHHQQAMQLAKDHHEEAMQQKPAVSESPGPADSQ
jgi:hypothetical protein